MKRFAAIIAILLCLLFVSSALSQVRIITETLNSKALLGNLAGDPTTRDLTIYLPPGYDRSKTRRFPVLYLLHGITSHPSEWLDGSYQGLDLRKAMDSLVESGETEYIIVMPDADNSRGGTFYVNSAAFGRWEDFIAKELVHYIDKRFRTIPNLRSRGIAGQSMGGFGALYIAGRHPETFGYVYAMSPACLGFVGEIAPDSQRWINAATAPANAKGEVMRFRTMAAAFAPPKRPASSTLETPMPFVPDSNGKLQEVGRVLSSWRKFLPLEIVERDSSGYRRLRSIAMDFGREDQIASVPLGTRAFAGALRRAGISYTLDEYTGGHVDKTRVRFETGLLPFFSKAFAASAKK